MRWVAAIIASICYWLLIAFLMPVVAMLHGDCGLESGPALSNCFNEKRVVLGIFALSAITVYVLSILWFKKKTS
jgi:hypothetical protein